MAMAASSFWRHLIRSCATGGLIGLAVSDRYASVVPVTGNSMHPTFEESFLGNLALVEKVCLRKFNFSQGDVVLLRSPTDHTRHIVKRIIGLPGDWVIVPEKEEILNVPDGYCWIEGDNSDTSLDSRSFGSVPLGLIRGRITHVIWPPHRIGQVERKVPERRFSSLD